MVCWVCCTGLHLWTIDPNAKPEDFAPTRRRSASSYKTKKDKKEKKAKKPAATKSRAHTTKTKTKRPSQKRQGLGIIRKTAGPVAPDSPPPVRAHLCSL